MGGWDLELPAGLTVLFVGESRPACLGLVALLHDLTQAGSQVMIATAT